MIGSRASGSATVTAANPGIELELEFNLADGETLQKGIVVACK
jgi:hypothetical protein